jgi:hypothetical protein
MYGKSSRIVGKGGDALRITASNYTLSHQRFRSVIFLGKFSSFFEKYFEQRIFFHTFPFILKFSKKNFKGIATTTTAYNMKVC